MFIKIAGIINEKKDKYQMGWLSEIGGEARKEGRKAAGGWIVL